jgi:uncharacterized protein YbjT (DUF2867 family)
MPASPARLGLLHETGVGNWRKVMGVNLDGVAFGMMAEITEMLKAGGGSIVNIASVEAHRVRALVRDAGRARDFPAGAEVVTGDLTRAETLDPAVEGIDAVVFTHGSNGDRAAMEAVDYGGVRNVLAAIGANTVRIALMTAIGVTDHTGSYNRSNEGHDWKRRSERLVRASGNPYTIVRPGWFDYNEADQHRLVLLQGDTCHSGTPDDGVIARRQIAEVLVHSLTSPQALRKTFELVAEKGPATTDFGMVFAPLAADPEGTLDGVRDADSMPLAAEPERVKADLETARAHS